MRPVALPALARLPAASNATIRSFAPPALLLLAMAALLVLVPPAGEIPINDDWNHAGAVKSLVEQGRLELAISTSASLVLQAYWGALFAKLFGFSFTALRASTFVLSVAAILGCYVLLREWLDAPRALLGSLVLLFNPLFVSLSFSFMTDVPFLALAIWAQVCYVRALRGTQVDLRWLAAGSTLAGGALLVRQPGALLPLAALGAVLLSRGWRAALRPSTLLVALAPLVPALLVGIYFDQQRGPVRQEPLRWTLEFWSESGLAMSGVVLSRLAEIVCTLGLFTLPLSAAALVGRSVLTRSVAEQLRGFRARERWLSGVLLAALIAGLVIRSAAFGLPAQFPLMKDILTTRGLMVVSRAYYNGTQPDSMVLPGFLLAILTVAAVLGGGLLVLACAGGVSRKAVAGPLAVPLLFGLLLLGLTAVYHDVYDRYTLPILPATVLVMLMAFRRPHPASAGWSELAVRGGPRGRFAAAFAGLALLAVWSISWEQEYLARRMAAWQVGQILVLRGIPPQEIDGGFEWNGWHRRPIVLAEAARRAQEEGSARWLSRYVNNSLHMPQARWAIAFAPPRDTRSEVLAVVPYWRGQQVFAVRRF